MAPHHDHGAGVIRYARSVEKRWRGLPGRRPSWRVDETYVRFDGSGGYLDRALTGGPDVRLQADPRRDVAAAKAFFRKRIKSNQRLPRTITLNGYAASPVRCATESRWLAARKHKAATRRKYLKTT